MSSAPNSVLETRVLLLAPTRRDGMVTQKLLGDAGLPCFICTSPRELVEEVSRGAAAIVMTDEILIDAEFESLVNVLSHQPAWSDLPSVLLVKSPAESVLADQNLRRLSNLTVVERPVPLNTMLSSVQAAVRNRERQYQIRDQVSELARAADQFEVMANAIPQLAWMASSDGEVFWYNRRFYEYTGTTLNQMANEGWSSVLDPAVLAQVNEKWEASLSAGAPFEMEYPIRRADGEYRLFLTRAEPIRDLNGRIVRWLGTNTDIEEQRRLRHAREVMLESERGARIEAERVARLKDEFLATLSHELRTPLSAILGWAYLLRMKPDDRQTVMDASEIIERSSNALKQLVEDLLDLSRIISGKVRLDVGDVELGECILAALESVRPAALGKGVEIKVDLDGKPHIISGDSARLQQVIWNLVSNALKFTREGGIIWVTLSYTDDEATIEVADNGEGIDASFLPHLFEKFRQGDASTIRRQGGLGIGLSLVKQFTELHGGRVEVRSPGKDLGSTFRVILPLHVALETSEPATSVEHVPAAPLPDIHGCRILIVDDEPGVRSFLHRILEDGGATIATAGSVDEAYRHIEVSPPDLLISDIGMPVRDGYDLIRQVREHGFEMPAIALTAFARTQDRDQALMAGFQRHLAKPVNPAQLFSAVGDLLGSTVCRADLT